MDKHSKYRPLLDKIQSEIMRAEVGVTGVYQYMLEALDGAETVEVALREELAALKQSTPKIKTDTGQAWIWRVGDLEEYANKIEAE
jgi:hypothetical protein